MSGYRTPVDIANRALQHCRMARINAFTDTSANALETSFVYDKLRLAELRRRVWRFAIRRAILRAIDTTTVIFTPAAYDATTTYGEGAIVSYSNDYWQSAIGSNTGNTPGANGSTAWRHYYGPITADPYVSTTSYFAGELVTSAGTTYLSLSTGNTSAPPAATWLAVDGTTAALNIVYPIGTGPISNSLTQNVFRLPYGYLRKAPRSPKGEHIPVLGGISGNTQEDWIMEGNYIVSFDVYPILFRYVADVTDVPDMDAMFCEGLSARIAEEVSPVLVPKETLNIVMAEVRDHYKREMSEAGIVNAIEQDPVDAEEDDFISVRY